MEIFETGRLFENVQMNSIFPDGKTFPDCVPKRDLKIIQDDYQRLSQQRDFSLKEFVSANFSEPPVAGNNYRSDTTKSAADHIKELWATLTRQPANAQGSLIRLPNSYVVPGGRFREIYYWDSYFTMLGLLASGKKKVVGEMIDNFSYLIDRYGFIPNGNRTYFLGRSQPPFYSLMLGLLRKEDGDGVLKQYLPFLEKEYAFWMRGVDTIQLSASTRRVVKMADGSVLNRYWDEYDSPRPEAFKEDVELSHQSKLDDRKLFRHLRAAAESGWDFSTRWFSDPNSFASIHTTDIVPVDLNCLLVNLEKTLADAYRVVGKTKEADILLSNANDRVRAIQKFCWNESASFYFDFDFVKGYVTEARTLAAAFPLFFSVATEQQAHSVATQLKENFLKHGGLTTTLHRTGQQWDAPNGWAPLQWIAFKGLLNYGINDLANEVRTRWTTANEKVYQRTGKMTEKYDVWNHDADASGGEYPNQDGFGWTNGVYLGMKLHP